MSKVCIFMANGSEEIEGLTVVDILRRAGITIDMVSITGEKKVTSSHKVTFETDYVMEEIDLDSYDGVVLPGGMPGTLNLGADQRVVAAIKKFAAEGKLVAAICAAPSVLGENGLLEGKKAVSYPGFEGKLEGATVIYEPVAVDHNVITGRGMGAAIEFSLAIMEYFEGREKADKMRETIIYNV